MTIELNGRDLTVDEVVRVACAGEPVVLSPLAVEHVTLARAVVDASLERGEAVYGLTTGVGALKRARVTSSEEVAFNRRLLAAHLIAQGPPAPPPVVRAQALSLLNGFASGDPGVRVELAERVLDLLNGDCLPPVRQLGSLGQSDLAANADLATAIFAGGFDPAPGETLAVLNNNAFSTGWAALALSKARRLLCAAEAVGALSLEAFQANLTSLHPAISERRPYPGLTSALARLARLLNGSYLWEPGAARNLQDPLTFRNLAQQQGAARDAVDHALSQLAIELNASQGNPLVVPPPPGQDPSEGAVISVADYEILPLAQALDYARIALAPMLTSANERALKLLDTPWSGLPTGLVPGPATADSGLSHYAIAGEALAAEARLLAHPVSFETASSAGAEGIEDRMTMAPLGARRLAEQVELGERILAIELLVAAQAVELRGRFPLGEGTARLLRLARELVPFMAIGDPMPTEIEPLRSLVASGRLSELPR